MKIRLNTIKDVKDFVDICIRYAPSNIDVKQDRQVISGSSILGIFSLDLLRPLKVFMDDENYPRKIGFYDNIQRWKIDDTD